MARGGVGKNAAKSGWCLPMNCFGSHKDWVMDLDLPNTQWKHLGDSLLKVLSSKDGMETEKATLVSCLKTCNTLFDME